jgi:hypothetical protein
LKEKAMSRLCRVLLIAVVALGVAAPSAGAVPDKKLGDYLAGLWRTALEIPTSQNPLAPGVGAACIDLGGVVAPFGGNPPADFTCTVKPGTKIFVAAWSAECSTVEPAPFFGGDEAKLQSCAQLVDADIELTEVSLDGKPLATTEVTSGAFGFTLPGPRPEDNILGATPGAGPTPSGLPYLSAAHGFVALLHPLTPGTHKIKLVIGGTFVGSPLDINLTTTIIVKPGL